MNDINLNKNIKLFFTLIKKLEISSNMDISNDIIIDGIIKRFEISFDYACKIIANYLAIQGICTIDTSPKNLIYLSKKHGLIYDEFEWSNMLSDRLTVFYNYDYETSLEIVTKIRINYFSLLNDLKIFLECNV